MKRINLLLISIAFPPKKDSESLQVAKYIKYLIRSSKFNIDVITSANPTLFMPTDNSLQHYSHGIRQLIEISFFENKYISFLLRTYIPNKVLKPDSKYHFHLKSDAAIKKLKYKPDIIYSRSFPLSSSIMAYKIQQHFHVPWIMHLSDPWTLGPIHSIEHAHRWNKKFERKCLNAASLITFTSEKTIECYSKHYPELANKMVLTPNVFDIDDTIEKQHQFSNKIRIVYTGGLVEDRSPHWLIAAFDQLKSDHPTVAADFEIIFAGGLDRKNRAVFKQCFHSEIRHVGLLSFKEALDLQNQADLLLLIDTPMNSSEEALFFPSKLLDYMLAKKRSIAITDVNSTTWKVMHESDLGDCVTHRDTRKLVTILMNTWKAWKNKQSDYFTISSLDMNYSAHVNADKLTQYFEQIHYEQG